MNDSPLRIAFFVDDFPSYTQTFVLGQVIGILELGHQVDIFALRRVELPQNSDLDRKYGLLELTTAIPLMPKNRSRRIRELVRHFLQAEGRGRLKKLIRSLDVIRFGKEAGSLRLAYDVVPFLNTDGQYDIIHCHFGMLGPRALRLKLAGVIDGKLVTAFRGYDTDHYLSKHPGVYDQLFAEGDLFLPVSGNFGEWLVSKGCPAEKITVLHDGIDCDKFAFKRRFRESDEPTRIASIARLVEKKGLSYGIDAVHSLIKAGRKIHYTVVGEGPLRSELEAQVKNLNLQDNVSFPGWMSQAETISVLDKSHLLMAPSITAESGDQEGIPNALKEAMAMGMPVVGTFHSGIPELVEDGVSGYLVPERDSQTLAARLMMLVDHPERWEKMGRAGYDKIKAEYDLTRLNVQMDQLYRKLKA